MTAKDEWILFIENHPEFNELSRSGLYISLLKFLEKSSFNIDKIHSSFPRVENTDLDTILGSLLKLKLAAKFTMHGQILYAITPLGRELTEIYRRARKGFKIE